MASSSSAVKVVLFRAVMVGTGWSSVQEMQHTWRETSFLLFYLIVARKNGRIHIKVQRPGIFAAGAL